MNSGSRGNVKPKESFFDYAADSRARLWDLMEASDIGAIRCSRVDGVNRPDEKSSGF
jgi:hypothetical protein